MLNFYQMLLHNFMVKGHISAEGFLQLIQCEYMI